MDKPTILFISKFIPTPAFDGGALRTKAWLEFLLKKYNVILVGFWNKKYGRSQLDSINHPSLEIHGTDFATNIFKKIYLLLQLFFLNKSYLVNQYYNKKLFKIVLKILGNHEIDLTFCSELSATQYVLNLNNQIPIYLDDHNVEFRLVERMSRNSTGLKKIILAKESRVIKKYEKKAIIQAKKTFVVSQIDQQAVFDFFKKDVLVVNNVFNDHGGFKPNKLCKDPKIVFVGNLSWAPNKHGLSHFLTHIYPQVLEAVPNIIFDIIGSNLPKEIIKQSKNLPINFLDEVSDDNKYNIIGSAWAGIVPLYFASGSRIKILEFWSHGKCVVTTRIGLEGLLCPAGTFSVDTDQEFVSQLINVLRHKEKLHTLGSSNYQAFTKNYSKQNVYEDSLYHAFTTK